MYLASISADLWPVWRMMSRSLTPFKAAWVTRGNDPANVGGYERGFTLLGGADRAADALEVSLTTK
jgi:hypothetical protein